MQNSVGKTPCANIPSCVNINVYPHAGQCNINQPTGAQTPAATCGCSTNPQMNYPADYYIYNIAQQVAKVLNLPQPPAPAQNSNMPQQAALTSAATPAQPQQANLTTNQQTNSTTNQQTTSTTQQATNQTSVTTNVAAQPTQTSTASVAPKVLPPSDECIKEIETMLNQQDRTIRLTGGKRVASLFAEDSSRKSDPALTALLNKMLQDPDKAVNYLALGILSAKLATGDELTEKLTSTNASTAVNMWNGF